jgi:tetratricopeptide (TPR) repeat protein
MEERAIAEGELPQLLEAGFRQQQAGQHEAAEAVYAQILRHFPRHGSALHLLGLCRHAMGDYYGAELPLKAATEALPAMAQVHLSYGNTLRELRRVPEAVASYERALALDPELVIAQYNLGSALEDAGRYAEANARFEFVLSRQANDAAVLGRANCLVQLGRLDEAIQGYRFLMRKGAGTADVLANLGAAYAKRGDFPEALIALEEALARGPDHSGALRTREFVLRQMVPALREEPADAESAAVHEARAQALYERSRARAALGQFMDAKGLLEQALALHATHRAVQEDLASILVAGGNTDDAATALRLLDDLLAREPGSARNWFNRSLLQFNLGQFDAARAGFQRAWQCDPQGRIGRFNVGLIDLLEGRFSSGWLGNEARWDDPAAGLRRRDFPQAQWSGAENIAGKSVLVHAEQGLGDTVQFSRYIPLLLARGARVIFEVQAPLAGLLRRCLTPSVDVVVFGENLPAFDLHCPVLSLPMAFATVPETIPPPLAGVAAGEGAQRVWRSRLADDCAVRVGLVWSGNPRHANDRQRSMRLAMLQPLVDALSGGGTVEFVALQNQLAPVDRAALAAMPRLQYFGETIGDFEQLAALISACDVVISVDTAALHLAGTMGKNCWAPLCHVPDWRWMLGRSDSPWYPSVRLFRQAERGNWAPVIEAMTHALREFLLHGGRVPTGPRAVAVSGAGG